MALGLDLRKRGGSKTGFVVGRLRTIKSSLRSSKLRRRSRRDKLELESDDDMHGKGRLPSSKSKSVLTGRKLNDRREWKGSVREGKMLNDRSERKGSVREEVKPENTVWRRKKQDDTRDDSKYQNSNRNRVSRDDGRNSELTHQNTEKPSLKQRPKATKTEKRMNDAEGSNYPKDPTLNKIHKRQHGEQVSKSKGVSHQDELHEESIKRTRQKKSSNEESEAVDQWPKKIKKVIRIDPHDISNKRIDDSASSKEKVPEVETELSKNAQFRAIKPSHSILSFVEDNLLGRRRTNELKKAGYNIDLSAPLDNIPFSSSTERERIEESVFRNKLEFFAAAQVSASFPPPVLPEIAFAGRSNVGKSSLLNALTRQWGVVRTSDKPGHTQTINFFRLASKLCLVDLPGYGFAYAKEEVKDAWEELVKEYVSTREGLQRVCLLIDTKWGMKQRDHELIDLMERSRTPYQIVLTKTDLVFPIDIARRAMQIQEDLKTRKSTIEPIMMVSSKSGAGVRSLRTALAKFARFIKP